MFHETGAALQVINESQEMAVEERGNMTEKHSETQIMFLVGTQQLLIAPESEPEGSGAHPALPGPVLLCAMGAGMILLCRIQVVELEQDLQGSSFQGVYFSREMCLSDILLH